MRDCACVCVCVRDCACVRKIDIDLGSESVSLKVYKVAGIFSMGLLEPIS